MPALDSNNRLNTKLGLLVGWWIVGIAVQLFSLTVGVRHSCYLDCRRISATGYWVCLHVYWYESLSVW